MSDFSRAYDEAKRLGYTLRWVRKNSTVALTTARANIGPFPVEGLWELLADLQWWDDIGSCLGVMVKARSIKTATELARAREAEAQRRLATRGPARYANIGAAAFGPRFDRSRP